MSVRPFDISTGLRLWLVTGYDEVRQVLADQRFAKDATRIADLLHSRAQFGYHALFSQSLTHHMLNTDPPDHQRLRHNVGRSFSPRYVQNLRPRIEEITDEVLGRLDGRETVDLIDEVAFPVPIMVICEMCGVPDSDRTTFREWTADTVRAGQPDANKDYTPMFDYLRKLVAFRRENPGDDIISTLLADDGEDRLSDQEIETMIGLLVAAGHETTVNLIGNGMFALVTHPEQAAALRADRSLLPGAIEEFLRYDSPVNQATLRFTAETVEIGDVTVPAGEFVMVNIDSANHDGSRFLRPDILDLRRDARGHLAFGHGIHYCLGAPLARLEAEIVFGKLLDRYQHIELAIPVDRIDWRPSTIMRGLARLPLRMR
ncbi:cytochrome P450 family protein [Nocardia takedensis]|uniref:cytochrome P450 family protein n=1 Tax=Nocardia takedensis TaxID=259390 RepID=UPI0009FDA8AF|nr:cytochrome P450 [Nocardia takedensis]